MVVTTRAIAAWMKCFWLRSVRVPRSLPSASMTTRIWIEIRAYSARSRNRAAGMHTSRNLSARWSVFGATSPRGFAVSTQSDITPATPFMTANSGASRSLQIPAASGIYGLRLETATLPGTLDRTRNEYALFHLSHRAEAVAVVWCGGAGLCRRYGGICGNLSELPVLEISADGCGHSARCR